MIPSRRSATDFVPSGTGRVFGERGELAGGFESSGLGHCEKEQSQQRGDVAAEGVAPTPHGQFDAFAESRQDRISFAWTASRRDLSDVRNGRSVSLHYILATAGRHTFFSPAKRNQGKPTGAR
jgi:hypothetical protein